MERPGTGWASRDGAGSMELRAAMVWPLTGVRLWRAQCAPSTAPLPRPPPMVKTIIRTRIKRLRCGTDRRSSHVAIGGRYTPDSSRDATLLGPGPTGTILNGS